MCKSDQEIINNYLAKNPLKAKQRKQDKGYTYPCSACGSPVYAANKRPLTTYSGGLLDKFNDHIEDFPVHEAEDLCVTCKTVIRNMNIDMNSTVAEQDWVVAWTDFVKSTEDDNLDSDFLKNEKDYQGYSSTEEMEGTYKQFYGNSDKPLKL